MRGDGKIVQLKIGSTIIYINGTPVNMDVAPEITNDRTFLPAAYVAQAMGALVTWDAATNTVTIK
ncbi:MAG TPA: copper amine oxidase N-terminal domain-containing protein, partial [Syntrophomonadaceae bacterium]|nr:copper amine oxidase N-terminal domain-containing protein [Syntrophomonadaceae bacterium]